MHDGEDSGLTNGNPLSYKAGLNDLSEEAHIYRGRSAEIKQGREGPGKARSDDILVLEAPRHDIMRLYARVH